MGAREKSPEILEFRFAETVLNIVRVEVLFLRWLVVIGVVALAIGFVTSSHDSVTPARYEMVPLVQNGESAGLPLAGIIVDPVNRTVSAVLGGPAKSETDKEEFFVIWNDGGRSYATTFAQGTGRSEAVFSISAGAEINPVHTFAAERSAADLEQARKALRNFVDALPPQTASARR